MLDRSDLLKNLCNLSKKCASIQTLEEFKSIFHSLLPQIIPYEMAAFSVFDTDHQRIIHFTNLHYPQHYLTWMINHSFSSNGHIDQRMVWPNQPSNKINLENFNNSSHSEWLEIAHRYNIGSTFGYGQLDNTLHCHSYFSFARIAKTTTKEEADMLLILIPHLHSALCRVLHLANRAKTLHPISANDSIQNVPIDPTLLSERELNVLHWVSLGKTNYEIAAILGISEFTVKNHMRNILGKFNVSNRLQAVNLAIKSGFL